MGASAQYNKAVGALEIMHNGTTINIHSAWDSQLQSNVGQAI